MHNLSVTIVTDGRMKCLENLRQSFNDNTAYPERMDLMLIDNKNSNGVDLVDFAEGFKCNSFLFELYERLPLASAWNYSVDHAAFPWVAVLNDDIIFKPGWDKIFFDNITPEIDMYCICQPNSFSGFVINRRLWKDLKFREEYTSGGYEDEDYFLSLAHKYGCRTSKETFTKAIKLFYGDDCLLKHVPIVDKQRKKWDFSENEKVFSKYWKKSSESNIDSVQGKNGNWYEKI